MQQFQKPASKWSARVRISGFVLALLILIGGGAFWALNSLNSLPALLTTLFGALATIFTFLQLIPIIFQQKPPESAPASSAPVPPAPQPINIYNVMQPPQPTQAPSLPITPTPSPPATTPASADSFTLRALPLPTDPRSIQQREAVVKDIYAQLIAPDTSAVALTGIGGIGKSTLAALVLKHAEQEHRAGKGPFRGEPILLRINENTSFLELAANLFAAVSKPMPDLSNIPPQNQAFAAFSALNAAGTADVPRLIVLDQFENLLDLQSGRALTTSSGVGEFLDALNSQPCACRVLLTSRPRPHGTRDDPSAALRIYRVGGLDALEGMALLRSQGVTGSEAELREAVKRCDGHALSLTLLSTILHIHQAHLAVLLNDPAYRQLWEGRIAQNLLDRIFNSLPEPSRQLLCAFSVYREAVPIDAAQAVVTSTTKAQVLITLDSLLGQHLIQAQTISGHYQLHRIVATYAQNHFVANDEAANKQSRQAAHAKAAQYYLQAATTHCPARDKRRRTSEVQPLIEAVWQRCQAGQFQEAYELMEQEGLFGSLSLWGANTMLLELCQLLLSENWQFTPQQKTFIYYYIASTSSMLGQKQEALQYYQQALLISREVGDRGGEGTTLNNLGAVYNGLGQQQEALQYYQQALQIMREVGDRRGEGVTLNNLGRVYNGLGQQQEALQYYQQALLIRREVGDRRGEGLTLHNIGMIYSSQGRDEIALACILLAKVLFEGVQSPSDVDDEVQWIAGLRKRIGKKRFTTLLARVEPGAAQIVEEALRGESKV